MTAVERQPAFAPGERVRVVTVDVGPYKRPPEYAEDAVGTVKGVHGTYATTADGEESYLYSVRFDGKRLWDDPDANRSVRVDLWEGCLAGLSVEERTRVAELLRSLNADGLTFVVVEHDIDFVEQVADTVTVLHQGECFRQGSIEAIRDDGEVRRIYLGGA